MKTLSRSFSKTVVLFFLLTFGLLISNDIAVATTCYYDGDHDGYGAGKEFHGSNYCSNNPDYSPYNTDCDDNNFYINPDTIWYKDADGDGHSDGSCTSPQCDRPVDHYYAEELIATSGDCNDADDTVHPGATDMCGDSINSDCDINGSDCITFELSFSVRGANDVPRSVRQTADGGYIIVGETRDIVLGWDVFITKVNPEGSIEWSKVIVLEGNQTGHAITEITNDPAGGYLLAYRDPLGDIYLMKRLSDGEMDTNWGNGGSILYQGGPNDHVAALTEVSDGYVFLADKYTGFTNKRDLRLVKIDADGVKLWDYDYGGTEDESCTLDTSLKKTSNGGFLMVGYTQSFISSGHSAYFVVKTDSSGNRVAGWGNNPGLDGTSIFTRGTPYGDFGNSISETSDGGLVVVGSSGSQSDGRTDIVLYKADSNGTNEKSWIYAGFSYVHEYGNVALETFDENYVVIGTVYPSVKARIMKIDKDFTDGSSDEIWGVQYGDSSYDTGISGMQTSDGGYIILGDNDYPNIQLIKTNDVGLVE